MPAGLKTTSSIVAIGFELDESAANTFTQTSVDLNLSPLDREVFVVLAINLDVNAPDCITGTPTNMRAALSSTSQTAVPSLADSNCLARISSAIQTDAQNAVGFTSSATETVPATLEYLGIIATNDFFVQVKGSANTNAGAVKGKLYGYRARADASIYSALVQSEVLSA